MTAMTSVRESAPRLAVASLPLLTLFATAVLAQDAAPAAAAAAAAVAPTVDKGDVAWMLVSTLLVTLMAVPGLALFYGGLVRAKNMLSVLMQVLVVFSLILVLWAAYGYSLAFVGGNAVIGSLDKLFLAGVTKDSLADTFTATVKLPEYFSVAGPQPKPTYSSVVLGLVKPPG